MFITAVGCNSLCISLVELRKARQEPEKKEKAIQLSLLILTFHCTATCL